MRRPVVGAACPRASTAWRPLRHTPDPFETYRCNLIDRGLVGDSWPDWLDMGANDVVKVARDHAEDLEALRGEVDLIAGGPPCQGFLP